MGIVKARLAWREPEVEPVQRSSWRNIVDDIARKHGTTYRRAIAKGKKRNASLSVRVDMARALHAGGYTSTQIGRWLNRDHTTALWYLGRLKNVKRQLP